MAIPGVGRCIVLKHLWAIVGAVVGMTLFRSVWAALLGAFVGNYADRARHAQQRQRRVADRDFVAPLFALLGAVAKSDGRVSEREIGLAEALMQRLQLDATWRQRAIEAFHLGKDGKFAAARAIDELRQWTGGSHDLAYPIVDVVVDVVLADGAPTPAKLELLKQLAWALRVSELQLMAMLAMKGAASQQRGGWQQRPGHGYGGGTDHARSGQRRAPTPDAPDPYAVLGVTRDADNATIKHAYRKLISQHHPDRLGNLPDDLRRRAEQRASAINAAWDRIKEMRGIA